MSGPKQWLQRAEVVMVVGALLLIVIALVVSRLSGS